MGSKWLTDVWGRARDIAVLLTALVALLGLLRQGELPSWTLYPLVALVIVALIPVATYIVQAWRQLQATNARRRTVLQLNDELDRLVHTFSHWLTPGTSDNFAIYIFDALGHLQGNIRTVRPASLVTYDLHFQALEGLFSRPPQGLRGFQGKAQVLDTFFRLYHESWVQEPLWWLSQNRNLVPPDSFGKITHHRLAYDTFLIRYQELCQEIQRQTGVERLGSWCYDHGPEI